MAAPGTWVRTLGHLSLGQLFGRPSYRLRRLVAPRVLGQALSRFPSTETHFSTLAREAPVIPWDDRTHDLLAVSGILSLFAEKKPLPGPPSYKTPRADPLWVYGLHELSWYRAAWHAADKTLRGRLEGWLIAYLKAAHPWSSAFWDPYPMAGRILNLASIMASGSREARAIAASHIATSTLVLSALEESHLEGNHLFRDHCGLAAGSLALASPGAKKVHQHYWKGLASELGRQLLSDGGHEERVPGYHLHVVMDLLMTLASPEKTPDGRAAQELFHAATKAVTALDVMTHSDGNLAAFGDTAPLSVVDTPSVRAFASKIGIEAKTANIESSGPWKRQALDSFGLSRLETDRLCIFVRHGEFASKHQPAHAHCDLFAIELDLDGHRFIVDPGVHAYHQPEWRRLTRVSAEHSTPSSRDAEQAEIWHRFRCGWRPSVGPVTWRPFPSGWEMEGWAEAFGPRRPRRMRRRLRFLRGAVQVEDHVDAAARFSVALTLAPGVRTERNEKGEWIMAKGDRKLLLRPDGILVTPARGFVSHRFGERSHSSRLILCSRGPHARWSLLPIE